MGMSESEVQQLIQIDAAKRHCILLRNNSGALKDETGRIVRFGLGNVSKKQNAIIKSLDLVGIKTMVIRPEMVGRLIGVFATVEVKAEDWVPSSTDKHEMAQRNHINWVLKRGGIAGFANNLETFRMILGD